MKQFWLPMLGMLMAALAGCMESSEPDRSSDASDEGASVQMERQNVDVEER